MIRTDLHTHTVLCDGRDTPDELVAEAFKRGFSSIGITGHSYVPFDEDCCMSPENTERYKAGISALKERYKGKMDIFLGLEQDYYSAVPGNEYDYIIGSVHYIMKDGKYHPIDLDPETLDNTVDKYYNGDFDSLAEEYFSMVADVVNKTDCDIIGHIDLISKFFEKRPKPLTDRYKNAALGAVRALIPFGRLFEINVGAMTRGYRTSPFPAEFILKEIYSLGGRIVINGDCHNKTQLGDHLDTAAEIAEQCGFSERYILTPEGFRAEKL